MKALWIFRTIFVVLSLAAGCVCTSAHAQGASQAVSVNVPFGFEVGSTHLPAGTYKVSRSSTDILQLGNRSQGAMLITYAGQSSKPTTSSKLVFDRYGDHYFLRQVWFNPEDNTYVECPQSKAEKQAKRAELEANTKTASNVEIAGLRIP